MHIVSEQVKANPGAPIDKVVSEVTKNMAKVTKGEWKPTQEERKGKGKEGSG